MNEQNVSSLEQALQNFVNPEFLRNENAYKCLKCKKPVVARKQFTVYRAPNVATFQLKRFDSNRAYINKLTKFVSYPETLDLRPYMSEEVCIFLMEFFQSNQNFNLQGPPLMYKLISVLIHHGATCNSGHYYCFVRNSNNSWYRMDDCLVSQVGLEVVLNQKAYILFYIRKHKENSIRISSNSKIDDRIISDDSSKMIANSASNQKCDNNQSPQKTSTNGIFNSNFKFTLNQSQMKNCTTATTLRSHTKIHTPTTSLFSNNNKQQDCYDKIAANLVKLNTIKNSNNSAAVSNTKSNTNGGLVPYDDDQDLESDGESKSENKPQPTITLPTVIKLTPKPTVTISHKDKSGHSGCSSNHNKDGISLLKQPIHQSSVLSPKEPKIAIKVKATTNSWKVVEATPSASLSTSTATAKNLDNSVEKSSKAETIKSSINTSWRISKTKASSSSDETNTQSSCSNSGAEDSFNPHQSEKDKNVDNNNSKNTDKISLSKQQNNNGDKSSKKKKKRKKDKSKKRKHNDNDDNDDDDDDDDMELNWVERTKETLEMENGIGN